MRCFPSTWGTRLHPQRLRRDSCCRHCRDSLVRAAWPETHPGLYRNQMQQEWRVPDLSCSGPMSKRHCSTAGPGPSSTGLPSPCLRHSHLQLADLLALVPPAAPHGMCRAEKTSIQTPKHLAAPTVSVRSSSATCGLAAGQAVQGLALHWCRASSGAGHCGSTGGCMAHAGVVLGCCAELPRSAGNY